MARGTKTQSVPRKGGQLYPIDRLNNRHGALVYSQAEAHFRGFWFNLLWTFPWDTTLLGPFHSVKSSGTQIFEGFTGPWPCEEKPLVT